MFSSYVLYIVIRSISVTYTIEYSKSILCIKYKFNIDLIWKSKLVCFFLVNKPQ